MIVENYTISNIGIVTEIAETERDEKQLSAHPILKTQVGRTLVSNREETDHAYARGNQFALGSVAKSHHMYGEYPETLL
jgi:hypothetical protein